MMTVRDLVPVVHSKVRLALKEDDGEITYLYNVQLNACKKVVLDAEVYAIRSIDLDLILISAKW